MHDKMVTLVIRQKESALDANLTFQTPRWPSYLNPAPAGIDQSDVRLLVGGLIDRQSTLDFQLHKYFLKISFQEISREYQGHR